MRLRPLKNGSEIINNSRYIISNPKEYKGNFNKLFNNNNPIYLEIGMGMGKFIVDNAIKYPNINFIGIEKFDSVISRAIKKIGEVKLDNLRLIRMDASDINVVFDKEIDKLYLNFSDPWPKEKHIKKRLTSPNFLKLYDSIFKNENIIEQKTDNVDLFNYSIESLKEYGYIVNKIPIDNENITTEYEEKFLNRGIKINKLIATKKEIKNV